MNIVEDYLHGSLNPKNCVDVLVYNSKFKKEHPTYFNPEGILVFCGSQGSGKTLSAVQYIKKILQDYPKAIFCTNTKIEGIPETTKIIEYEGLESLTSINNEEEGVVYFIDEIHLELNSLESKNVPISYLVELSQARKQRKHIIGTSQVYTRMAKPLREQIKNVVMCKKFLWCFQFNRLIDGENSYEKNGKLCFDTEKVYFWIHNPKLYGSYDTFAKMKRYSDENKNNKFKTGGALDGLTNN